MGRIASFLFLWSLSSLLLAKEVYSHLPKLLDEKSKSFANSFYPFPDFDRLVTELDKLGMDILIDWFSNDVPHSPERPRLAPLSGFPYYDFPNAFDPLSTKGLKNWNKEFIDGAKGALLGFKVLDGFAKPTKGGLSNFLAEWDKVDDPSKRVFISYTGMDQTFALKLKKMLEHQGYVVFNYLNHENNIHVTAEQVGKFFIEAENRYVIDTWNSRKSDGVVFEARFNARLNELKNSKPGDYKKIFAQILSDRSIEELLAPKKKSDRLDPVPGVRIKSIKKQVLKDFDEALAEIQKMEKISTSQRKALNQEMAEWIKDVLESAPSEQAQENFLRYSSRYFSSLNPSDFFQELCNTKCTRCKLSICIPFCPRRF